MTNYTFKSIIFFLLTFSVLSITAQGELPSEGVFRMQNVATGKYLTDAGSITSAVTMQDSGEQANTHFKFVQSGSFYNIDSETLGILRTPGAGDPGAAYVVVSTTKSAPTSDTDKTWTISYNQSTDT